METLLEFKCPCCGGAVQFDSGLQKLKCPYCDSELEVDALREQDEVLKNAPQDEMHWQAEENRWSTEEAETLRVYVCNSCGGEIVAEETTGATLCPYCGNTVVMAGAFSGGLRPDYVLPFQLDKEAAKAAFSAHLKGKRLLPKVFSSEAHIDKIQGLYVPFWLFDADADAELHFHGTRTRVWSDSRYNYTETAHFAIDRAGSLGFDRVPVDGAGKMPDALMESIEPFDYAKLVPFRTAYLAGYLADKYDVPAEKCIPRANERIKSSTEQAFRDTIHNFSTVRAESSSVCLQNAHTHYALLPVWMMHTTWRKEEYLFAMNGQSGKFVGNLPMDRGAFWRWFLGLTFGVGAAVVLLALLVHGLL